MLVYIVVSYFVSSTIKDAQMNSVYGANASTTSHNYRDIHSRVFRIIGVGLGATILSSPLCVTASHAATPPRQ